MKPSKAYSRYSALLNYDYLAEGQIRSLRSLLCNGSGRTTLTSDERNSLRSAYEYETASHYRIFPEHEAKGLEFLRRCLFRKDGKPRQDKRSSVFFESHRAIVSNFHEFYFVGYSDATCDYGLAYYHYDRRNYLPVYRCCGEAGWFDYCYGRDSGEFEILDGYDAASDRDMAA